MKNKGKIYKSIFLIGTGVTLAHGISYNLCVNGLNVKPFEKNEYDLYRTDVLCYSKDGVTKTSDYQYKNQNDKLVIRDNKLGFLGRTHNINADRFSDDQINYIIENIGNVETLVNEDYIKDIVTDDVVENFDEYSFEYIQSNVDRNDVKHYASNKFDTFALIYHLVLATAIF